MLVHLLCERRVDGLLVVPAGSDHRFLLPELRHGTPIVFIDRPPGRIEADVILLDNVGGARAAVEHLLAHGHRRIAIVADTPTGSHRAGALPGYREALDAAGLAVDRALVRSASHDSADGARTPRASCSRCPRARRPRSSPATTGSRPARCALSPETAASRSSASTTSSSRSCVSPPVTVVAYDAAELGRGAPRASPERLDGDDRPPQRIVLPTTLVPRGSGEIAA